MQTIGLIGGMSWESSAAYYQGLNLGVEKRLGGLSSPTPVMASVDFAEVTALQDDERWDDVAAILAAAARGVEGAGADFLMLCTTTFHRVAEQVEAAVSIPLLHLGDVVADACEAAGVESVGFLGTTFAMSALVLHRPDRLARDHRARPAARAPRRAQPGHLRRARARQGARLLPPPVVGLIDELWDAGAAGVILGCTELELLVHQADSDIPVFPCTTLHVEAALDRALAAPPAG